MPRKYIPAGILGVHERVWLSVKGCCALAPLKRLPGILGSLQGMEVGHLWAGQGSICAHHIVVLGQGRCELA